MAKQAFYLEKYPSVTEALEIANININSKAAKSIIKFEKSAFNSWENLNVKGGKLQTVLESRTYEIGLQALELLNGNDFMSITNPPKFYKEWCNYVDAYNFMYASSMCRHFSMGDCLA